MKQNYSEELKLPLVARYRNGESATDIAADAHVPRSTLYSWIKMHQQLKSTVAETISYKEYVTMKRHAQKLAEQLAVLQAAGCGAHAPLKEKLQPLMRSRETTSTHLSQRPGRTVYTHVVPQAAAHEQGRPVIFPYRQTA